MNTICVFPACSLLGDKFNKLQFFCTPFPSHKRTMHYLKIEILVPNARSNFDVPHINSYLSRISNVINLLRFLQRCRSPSPILTSAPHCSLPRSIIRTLIALYPNRLSFLGHLKNCTSPVTCIPTNLPSTSERHSYFGGSVPWTPSLPDGTVCINWWWMQLALLDPRLSVRVTSMDTLTASDLR